MNTHLINGLVLLFSLSCAAAFVLSSGGTEEQSAQGPSPRGSGAKALVVRDKPTSAAQGTDNKSLQAIKDVHGHSLVPGGFHRIVSLHTTADQMLPALLEADRIAAVSGYSRNKHPDGWRLSAWPFISNNKDIESILSFRPDLVIVSALTDLSVVARLREEGVKVFALPTNSGLESSYAVIETLGRLLGVEKRARALIRGYRLQAAALEQQLQGTTLQSGMYLSIYGDALFGGSKGSSYADLLRLGGISDLAAAQGYEKWPKYTVEQLLELNPALIVTPLGKAKVICSQMTLRELAACGPAGRIIELPDARLSEPGPGLLRTADRLQTLLFDRPHEGRG